MLSIQQLISKLCDKIEMWPFKKRKTKWEKVLTYLINGQFDKIWKGKDFETFRIFLDNEYLLSKGFVISFPLRNGSLAWVFFLINDWLETKSDKLELIFGNVMVSVPTDDGNIYRECPEEWKGYPIWRVTEKDLG